jgi:hypothetical protein
MLRLAPLRSAPLKQGLPAGAMRSGPRPPCFQNPELFLVGHGGPPGGVWRSASAILPPAPTYHNVPATAQRLTACGSATNFAPDAAGETGPAGYST